jgi:hypothetical protein
VADVVQSIETLCGRRIPIDPGHCLLELNHHLFISVVISRCFTTPSGNRRWKIRFDSSLHPDITVAVRMDTRNEWIKDYYILPALEFSQDQIKLSEDNIGFLDSFRADTLDYLLNLSVNISLDRAVKYGARGNSTYSH